jgi:hypothetical protein
VVKYFLAKEEIRVRFPMAAQFYKCSRSSTDRVPVFGTEDVGSIPTESTYMKIKTIDWHKDTLKLNTIITDNYKNTQNVRRFMISHLGEEFHFTKILIKWIKNNQGKTLNEVIKYYLSLNK